LPLDHHVRKISERVAQCPLFGGAVFPAELVLSDAGGMFRISKARFTQITMR
jgi:hypothetical protein